LILARHHNFWPNTTQTIFWVNPADQLDSGIFSYLLRCISDLPSTKTTAAAMPIGILGKYGAFFG